MKYCPQCGSLLQRCVIDGQPRNRWLCDACGERHYDYPRIVTHCLVACGKRLLWVQRAIPPRQGLWAIPGGFLECGESLQEGAVREVREEAGVTLDPLRLQFYMAGTLTAFNQVYIAFRASVDGDSYLPGVESMACGFFTREECPWRAMAYPEVNTSIAQAYDDLDSGRFGIWEAEMASVGYRRWQVREH